jgi:hypothetical protein
MRAFVPQEEQTASPVCRGALSPRRFSCKSSLAHNCAEQRGVGLCQQDNQPAPHTLPVPIAVLLSRGKEQV